MKTKWKVGDTYHYNRRKYHIVAILEDNGETLYVVKFYGRYKQWWHYSVAQEYEGKLF